MTTESLTISQALTALRRELRVMLTEHQRTSSGRCVCQQCDEREQLWQDTADAEQRAKALHDLAAQAEGESEAEIAAYEAGSDAAINGLSATNSNFGWFTDPRLTAAWQRGYDDARRKTEP